jgi:hypothetical protein
MSQAAENLPTASAHETLDALVERSGRSFIPFRRQFVQRKDDANRSVPGPLAEFVRANDRFGLLLYLLLMTCASGGDFDVSLHTAIWARALGVADPMSLTARTRVSKGWHRLVARQLVDRGRRRRTSLLTPLCEDGGGDPYTRPKSHFIKVSHGLWTEGPPSTDDRWYEVLTLPELAVLFIALMNADDFALPAERAPEYYGVSADTFERGVRGLRKHGLIEVRRSRKAAPLAPEGYTIENRYTLSPPFGPHGTAASTTGAVR